MTMRDALIEGMRADMMQSLARTPRAFEGVAWFSVPMGWRPEKRRTNQNGRRGTFNRRTGETTRRRALRRGPRKIGRRKGRVLLRVHP